MGVLATIVEFRHLATIYDFFRRFKQN